ncbi:MAG: AraC family transcriptional regulator [Rhodospirillaceae bacterium]|nr:AraC family transcriptional regulator [Rhodospirillaceae bacterium]
MLIDRLAEQLSPFEAGMSHSNGAGMSSSLGAAVPSVSISPDGIAKRQLAAWRGMAMEVVQMTNQEPFDLRFSSSWHLLIAYEQAERRDGETIIEGLPPSTRHDCSHRLTFVPAGREFREWQDPRRLTRATYFYLDPRWLADHHLDAGEIELRPCLYFENTALWQTTQKLIAESEGGEAGNDSYREALCVILLHDLLRLRGDEVERQPEVRGGLAGWQQKRVAEYIEENLAEPISLATLAGVVRLSPTHFARAFKQSFGMPPHSYHVRKRIERAKVMLADPARSVTEVALDCGFSAASNFSTVFRKTCGRTPMSYRRSLV